MGQKTLIFITILILTVVALAVIFVITLLISGRDDSAETAEEVLSQSTLTPASDVLDTPIVYENLRLELEEDIAAWVTKNSFTLLADSSTSLFGGASTRQLWIIFGDDFKLAHESEEGKPGLGDGGKVRVVGMARILDRDAVERALGNGLDDPKLFLDGNQIATDWEYGILIIGEEVIVVEEE